MNLFEPLFLLLGLVASVALVVAAVRRVRGDRKGARRVLRRLTLGGATYFAVVIATSLLVPQRVYRVGDQQCFDDWCITVSGARWTSQPSGERYEVTLQLSNRARRMPMGERGTVVYLVDAQGQR